MKRPDGIKRAARMNTRGATPTSPARYGLARVLSKRGVCSRSQAQQWILDGRVRVDGRIVRDPEAPTDPVAARIIVDDSVADAVARVHLMLNKPRGVVTTAADEKGRETVYDVLQAAGLPWVAPVGRLDKASEGLLLLTNDTAWSARLTDPESHVDKTYHVQIDALPDPALLAALTHGIVDRDETLGAKAVHELRRGDRNAWLEIVLDEGRNRQIRRLLAAHGIAVLRLVRVAIGGLQLGELGKGEWRALTDAEVRLLAR